MPSEHNVMPLAEPAALAAKPQPIADTPASRAALVVQEADSLTSLRSSLYLQITLAT